MTTYAESIMIPGTRIEMCQLGHNMASHIRHAETEIEMGRSRDHTVYGPDGMALLDRNNRHSSSIIPKNDPDLTLLWYERVQQYAKQNFNMQSNDSLVATTFEFFAYPVGAGLSLHTDDHVPGKPGEPLRGKDSYRGITSILYVNDDFGGGELVFPDHDLVIKPYPGLFVMFPSNRHFKHQVLPITSGVRYSYQRMYGILCGDTNSLDVD